MKIEAKIPRRLKGRDCIAIFEDQRWAPCSYLIALAKEDPENPGKFFFDYHDEKASRLIDTDWDHPSIASSFGWNGKQGDTVAETDFDGARKYIDKCVYNRKIVEDPGYFYQDRE